MKNRIFNKRVLAFMLTLLMIVGAFPAGAFAVSAEDVVTDAPAQSEEIQTVADGNVAKVGNTEYATIDDAIVAWTNGTTLTLLADVTLSKTIELSSTEYHVLDLGTYTMTAASRKDAIQIVNNGRSSASYALDIKADAENPGGITASGKAVVKTTGKSGVKDRPIIRFYGGVFTGTNVVYHSGSNGTNCPQFWFYGGEFNGTVYANRALFQFYGGTFNGSLQISVDSSAYALIAGGTFAKLSNLYGSALNSDKFTIGSAKGVYDRDVYVDDNGNYVIVAAEPAEGFEAAVAKKPGTNDYLAYSKVATEGQLNYTDVKVALEKNNTTSAKVTVYVDELDMTGISYKGTIVVPEGKTVKITNAPEDLKTEGNAVIVKPVAKIDDREYTSLEEAFAAAVDGETITLLANATPALTSQRAITKAAVIDLGGKTLALKEDDLYFGTTTFKNGTIVVDPSVKPSTAVFWMFANQTLTFDGVKIVATGVTGTYLIGLEGENSDLNILNGSEIVVENTTALDLDIICVNGSTNNAIVIDNSKVNVTNLDGRVFFRGNYTVKGASEITLTGITKAGFRIEAGQTLSIEDNAKVTITGEPRDGGIHLTDLTATYTKADTATVNATENIPVAAASINGVKYESLQAAIDAVQNGETITLLADCDEKITFTQTKDVSFVLDGNNKTMTGSIHITARAGKDAPSTLVIKNFKFTTDKTSHDFIKSVETNYYPNNITIQDCSFTGTGDINAEGYAVVAVRLKSANNILIQNCTGTGLHSFLQNTAGWNIKLDNVDVTKSLGGYAMGTVQGATITNCDLDVSGMGIRFDAQLNNNAVITNCNVKAFIPVVVRKASVASSITFEDANTMTATNTDNLWCAIGTSEYSANGTMPTAPTGKVTVTLNGTGLTAKGVYGSDNISPKGNDFIGYTSTDGIWGEVWGNASESFVIKVLDANGNVMGTTTLKNKDGIIDGDVTVTWYLKFDVSNTDEYWEMKWTTVPSINNIPAKVELWVDGFKVSGGNVVLNGPDDINKIVAASADAAGKITGYYTSLNAALEALNAGDAIVLFSDVNGNLELPANVILAGNGKQITGTLYLKGNVTFNGYVKANAFDFENVGTEINIPVGATLELTGTGRMVIGHGCTFNITGTITDAKTADKATIQPSLIMPGASFTGAGVTFNVTNAYIKAPSSYCSSSKSASGTFDFNITNSIVETAGKLAFEAQSTAATVNFELKDSVLTTGSHLVFGVSRGEIVIDNSNVNVGKSNQIENQSTMTIKNGSVVNGAVATNSNAKNPGTVIVDNATYAVTGEFSGSDLGTGTLIVKNGATVSAGSITNANIQIDATGMSAGELANFTANLSKFTGTVEVINNDKLEAKIVDGKIMLVGCVAKIGEVKYESLQAAINAAYEAGGTVTITLLDNVTEKVTVNEKVGFYLTIDGAGKEMNGNITVNPLSDENDNRRITIKAINFVNVSDAAIDFISAVKTNHYPRLSVWGCSFTGNGKNVDVAIRTKTAYDLVINDCTGTGLHSFLQNTAGLRITIEEVTVSNSKGGLALGTVQGVTVKGCEITVDGYGIRLDADTYNNNAVIESDTVNAFIPVVVRKANANSNITFQGTNTMTATNTDGLWCAIGTSEYEENGKLPAVATGAVKVTVNDTSLNKNGIYGAALNGSGTEADPFIINNVKDLIFFRDSVNAGETKYNAPGVWVALDADIDMAGATWERGIGDGINATFDGIFDGNKKTIKNLKFAPKADSDGYLCGGLFGYTYGAAVIKNLVLENITVTTTDAGHNVGALVGFAYNKGGKLNVSNIIVKNITIDAPNAYGVGAIVGYSYFDMGTIENCTVDVANIKGYSFVGGITGYSYSNAIITDCSVANATITATSKGAGGIAGLALNGNKITGNTVNMTTVSAKEANWGYVVGELGASSAEISNNTAAEPQIGGDYETGEAYRAKIGNKYYTSIADAIEAAKAGDVVTVFAGTYAVPSMKAGITLVGEVNADGTPAVLFNGTLSGTLENLTLKNIHIKGGNAQRWAYAKGNLVFENVTFEATSVYALHFDGIAEGTNLTYKNCTIIGWAAMGGSPASCVFDECTIKGNGTYGVIRTYFDATIQDCIFDVANTNTNDAYEDGIHAVDGAEVTVTDCTNAYGDMKDIVNVHANSVVTVDGVEIKNAAKIGDTYYVDLREALLACKAGETVTLLADVDLKGVEWEPIATFNGVFDGNNHTISNLVINGGSKSNQGFFGQTNNGEIKNITFNNAKVTGRLNVGVVAGTPYTSKYTNIKVTGHVEVNGMAYVGGVGGKNAYADWTDVTVDVDADSYVKATSVENGNAYRTYVGGVIGFNGEGSHTYKNISSNIKVIGSTCDIGGIFGIAHYGNNFENVTFTGSVVAPADAEEVGGIAGVWHNEKGYTVTFTDVTSTGTVTVGDVTTTGSIVGGAYNASNETAANSGSLIIDGKEAWLCVAKIGDARYQTLADAFKALKEGDTLVILPGEISEGTIKMPATLKNVTVKGSEGTVLKDMTIKSADGNSVTYEGLTFDGIVFDNSNVVLTGWRTGAVSYKDITVTGCTFKDIVRANNEAAFHINCDADEVVNGFSFTNNIVNGVSGASNSAVYAQVTGSVVFTNNIINNVAFRPYIIQLTSDDGIADKFVVTGNTFSGSANGRAQALTNNAQGTDKIELVVNGNIFKDITVQQICYWNFNPETTTADFSKNYYDIDILANPNKIYFNSAAQNAKDLIEMGAYPYYADEAMTEEVTAPAIMVTYPVGNPVYSDGKIEYYNNMLEAVPYTTNCPRLEGATITLLKDVSGSGLRFMENDMVFDLNGYTYTITQGTGSQGTNTSGFQIRPEVTTNVIFKNGTIKVAEGAPVVWMFNIYATDFIVENVTVDCTNMAWSYGSSCNVVVSREGDNVQFIGNTEVKNFNAEVAGAAYSVGGTMTVGENVVVGGTIKLDVNATLTAPAGLDVVVADGYKAVYDNGVYKAVKAIAQIGDKYYINIIEIVDAVKTESEAGNDVTIKFLSDVEITDYKAFDYGTGDIIFTADKPVTITLKKDFDFAEGSDITIKVEKNVTLNVYDNAGGIYVFYGPGMMISGTITGGQNWGCLYLAYGEHTVMEDGVVSIGRVHLAWTQLTVNGKIDTNYLLVEESDLILDGAIVDADYFTDTNNGGLRYGQSNISIINHSVVNAKNVELKHANSVLTIDLSSTITATAVKGVGTIVIDAAGFTGGNVMVIKADMSGFTGKVEVIGSNIADYEVTADGIVVTRTLEGEGSSEKPYLINNVEDLIFFRDSVNAGETKYNAPGVWVALGADIDLEGTEAWTVGIGDGHSYSFDGNFDGKNHTIKNLTINPYADSENPETAYICGGLFGYTYGAVTIKDLTLEKITVATDAAGHNVGILVGFANNKDGRLNVSNVTVTNVTIDALNANGVGAIVGYSYRAMGTIKNCTVDGANIKGYSFVGGITGYSYSDAVITGCTVKNATITAKSKGAGGIAGLVMSNTITDNKVENTTVTAPTNWGYVVGEIGSTDGVLVKNNTAAEPQVGGNYSNGEAVQAKVGDKYYTTLQAAIDAANGEEVILLIPIKIQKGATLEIDLKGQTVVGTDTNTSGNFYLIDNRGTLTIKDSVGGGKITLSAKSNRYWNASSVVVANNPGGKLVVEGGTIEHLGGTDMAYAIDNLTNGKGTYAETVINGGTIKSTYRAVRQFLNGVEAQNILTINGGTIEGANKSVWMQDPSKNANSGKLTVGANASIKGDVYLTVTAGSTQWPVEVAIASAALENGVTVVTNDNVPAGYELAKVNGVYGVYNGVAKIGGNYYATLEEAFKAAKAGDIVTVFAGKYAMPSMKAGITIVGVGEVMFNGTLSGTLENLTLKNIHIKGGNAQRWAYAKGDLVFENVTFEATSVYALHFDGIAAGTNLLYKDCTIIGWAAMGGSPASCVFDGCTIKGNGTYGLIRTYFDATIENCTFDVANVNTNDAYQDGIHAVEGAKVTVTGCTNLNGDMKDIVNVHANSVVTVDGVEIKNVAKIGGTYYATFADAIAAAQNGDEVEILVAGTYSVPTGKNITITGAVAGVVFDNIGAHNMGGASMTFNNVTFDYYPNVNYTGLQHSGNLVYNNCTFNGQVFLYGTSETFENCTFNQNSADAYNVWTYSAKEVAFKECTFNSAGKSVLIYHETATVTNDVTVTKSTFNATKAVEGKAAIEIDSSLTAGINLTIDAATTATGFGKGNISGNSLWNNKKDNKNEANNDITVVVNGETVLAPVTFVVQIGNNKYASLADAIADVKNGETIVFLTDIDEDVTIKQVKNVAFTIDGANYKYFGTMTVKGTGKSTAQGQALTIQNINFMVDGVGIDANEKSNFARNITIDGCTFTGTNGTNYDYGMRLHSVYNITVKNTVASNLFDLVYGRGSVNGFTAENVEVINAKNGIWLSYAAGKINFTNVTTDCTAAGVGFMNQGENGVVTFNSCHINYIEYSEQGTKALKMIFNDTENTMRIDDEFAHEKLTIVLNKIDTTVTAIEGLKATSGVEGYKVAYENGTYKLVEIEYVAQVGDKKYETLKAAIENAETGKIIKLLADFVLNAEDATVVPGKNDPKALVYINKNVTFDLNGHNLSAEVPTPVMFVFYVAEGFAVEITDSTGNGTVEATGNGLYYMFNNVGTMTITGGNYIFNGITGGAMFYSSNNNMTVVGGNFTQNNTGWMFNTVENGVYEITVSGGTFNRYFIGGNTVEPQENLWGEVVLADDKCLCKIGENLWTIAEHVVGEAVREEHTTNDLPCDYDMVVYCKVCNNELSREHIVVLPENAVAWNNTTEKYYETLTEALNAAKNGEKVVLLAHYVDNGMMTMVPAGVTLNLNGHYLTANNLFSFGHIIDKNVKEVDGVVKEVDGDGGIKISNDRTKAFTQLQQNNSYLPLYDATNGCYRFYEYTLSLLKNESVGQNAVKFKFRLRLSSKEAYRLLADTANSGIEFKLNITWTGMNAAVNSVKYVLSGAKLAEYANAAYNQVNSGEKLAMAMNKTIEFTLYGLSILESGSTISATPTFTSVTTGVVAERTDKVDGYTSFTYEAPDAE